MKHWRIVYGPFAVLSFLFGLSACTANPTREPVVDLPQYENAEQEKLFARACAPLAEGDVHAYLQKLSQDNFQLAGAWARVRQAQAQARQASAGLWPRVDLNLEASRSKAPFVLAGMGGGAQTGGTAGGAYTGADTQAPAVIQNQFQAAVAASYEVDAWNRLGSAADAARFAVQAQDANAQTLAVSLSAQLLESWYDLGFLHQQRDLLQRQLTTSEQLLELAKLRFLNGQASALDALQQKQEVQRLQASLAQNTERLAITANQLQVLLGESPLNALNDLGSQLPDFRPMDSDISLSAGLLSVRPDLAGAWNQLRAADAQVASAVANRLPGVRLTASLFDQGRVVENVGDDIFWRVAAAITQPIFNAGALDAQVDAARAGADQALLTYRDTFLRALEELANAWVGEAQAVERTRYLQAQQMLAKDAFELVQTQYQRGAVDFLRVLNAFTSMVSVEQELLRARRSHLSYRVQFCTALGDGWLPEGVPPEPVLAEHVP